MVSCINKMKQVVIFCVILLLSLTHTAHAGKESGRTIKLGIIGPLSFVAGEGIVQGATMAVEEINRSGGVRVGNNKYNIEIVKVDDNCLRSVSDAVSAMERLITVDKADFVIGGFHSESVLAQQDVIADHKKIFIDTGSASLKQPSRLAKDYNRFKYYFRININSIAAGRAMLGNAVMIANKVREELGVKVPRVALLLEKLLWVEPIVKLCQAKLPKMSMEVAGTWRPSSMATDLTAEWTAIKASNSHMVLQIASGPAGTVGPRQWGELQVPAALFGTNIQAMQGGHWKTTNKKCNYEATVCNLGPAEITPKTLPFYDAFDKKYGGYLLYIVATVYDAVNVLREAIERAGTLDSDTVVKELEKANFIGVIGRIVFEPPGHKFPHIIRMAPGYCTLVGFQWIDGKQVVVWPDGRALLGDKSYVGLRYGGTKDYVLPPWMVKYWKGR
ncbi:MAG: ABC transporter substrate-binding protein [Thermodesulfobacteriota bacterium]|nr:ABC transporter substrate-binding protein [Thermodesulfobacteriota bacterium]